MVQTIRCSDEAHAEITRKKGELLQAGKSAGMAEALDALLDELHQLRITVKTIQGRGE